MVNHVLQYITTKASAVYFYTNENAPNFRIVRINLKRPHRRYWKEIVPEDRRNAIENVELVNK